MSAKQKRQGTRMCVKTECEKISPMINKLAAVNCEQLKVSVAKLNNYLGKLQIADDAVLAELDTDAKLDAEITEAALYNDQLLEIISKANVLIELAQSPPTPAAAASAASQPSEHSSGKLKLPKLELSPFSGDVLEWQGFWDSFESSVHNNNSLSVIDKFNYLRGLLTGDALKPIAGYRITAANYDAVVATLKDRFGDSQMAIFAHFESMLALTPVQNNDSAQLQTVADACERHIRSLVALGLDESTFGQVFTPIMLSKLPRVVKIELHRKNGSQNWTLDHLREWLKDEIRARNMGERAFGMGNSGSKSSNGGNDSKSTKSTSNESTTPKNVNAKQPTSASALVSSASQREIKCAFCEQSHYSDKCDKYPEVASRRSQVQNRCLNCLGKGHRVKECTKKVPCAHCKKQGHHRSLCYSKFGGPTKDKDSNKKDTTLTVDAKPFVPSGTVAVSHSNRRTILQTAVAPVCDNHGAQSSHARLLFDTAGSRTFITENKAKELQLPVVGHEWSSIAGFQSTKRKTVRHKVVQFSVRCLDGSYQMVTASVVPVITCPIQKLPVNPEQYSVLSTVTLAESIVTQPEFVDIDVLIGIDHYYDFVLLERIHCPGGPILLSSRLGYIVTGCVTTDATGPDTIAVMIIHNSADSSEFRPSSLAIERFWDLEDIGMKDQPKQLSGDDEALMMHTSTLRRDSEGRYMTKWPWKVANPDLPDNFDVAYGRLCSLMKQFRSNPQIAKAYTDIVEDQLKKEIIEYAPMDSGDNPVYYMPHHCVVTPSKATTKVRVVYDASSKSRKDVPSLNECLHRGPVLLEDLCGLLMRFRIRRVALVSDIEKAFLQVGLQESDRDVTRFLWAVDPSLPLVDSNLVVFRFRRVPFGVISSPFSLENTVNQHLKSVGTPVAAKIEKDHYVDNVATGEDTVQDAIANYHESKSIFKDACMNLREWYTNSTEVRQQFAECDLGCETNPKMLGLRWDCDKDTLQVIAVKPYSAAECTKRRILKTVSQVFDPLGFYSPLTVAGKMLVQDLWKQKYSWDDPLPPELVSKWSKIVSSLESIPVSGIPRYLGTNSNSSVTLHVFCDASAKACAAAVYVQTTGDDGSSCNLLFAKTRLAPVKTPQTIPRLELVAVVIGVRLIDYVAQQLCLKVERKVVWSDSQCVLHWVKGERVLARFVANRVSEIHKYRDLEYRYVPSEDNPADVASRGCDVSAINNSSLWWKGPQWLVDESCWPEWPVSQPLPPSEDPEVTLAASCNPVVINVIDAVRFSSLTKLLRCTAYVFRFINNCKRPSEDRLLGPLSVSELSKAELFWHLQTQREFFPELTSHHGSTWPPGIGRELNLFRDCDDVIRCSGRIDAADLPYDAKYPVLLPKSSRFTELVILSCHTNLKHAGPAQTLAQLRLRYWVVHGRSTVRRVRKHCKLCVKKEGGPFSVPPIPALPPERVLQAPAFTATGLDYLGPLLIKDANNVHRKVWICLFTCMAVRSVHLEVVCDLSAEQFLLCLRRFIAAYGTPQFLLSDNGTQFRAAQNALLKLWRQVVTSESVQDFASTRGINWQFIVEFAPWMGGFYERLVGVVKRSLRKTLDNVLVTTTELQTVVAEIAAVINSRPLVYSEEEVGFEALTPAHFLAKARKPGLPKFAGSTEYLQKSTLADELVSKWKRLQSIVCNFWQIWHQQYLLSLRERNMVHRQRNCSEMTPNLNTVVHIKDALPRSHWKLARIVKLHSSNDGKVRSATLRLPNGRNVRRPIKNIFPLECDNDVPPTTGDDGTAVEASTSIKPRERRHPSRGAAQKAALNWREQLNDTSDNESNQ